MKRIYPTFALTQENSPSQHLLKQFESMQKELEPLDELLETVDKRPASNGGQLDKVNDDTKVDENQLLKLGLECTQRLHEQLSAITSFPLGVQSNFDKNDVAKILESALCVLEELKASLQQKGWKQAKLLLHYHLQPLLFLCSEACYFWGDVYPDFEKMELYYAKEFAEHFRAPNFRQQEQPRSYAYQLSIVVIALNHLEVTRQCIEHLLEYTDFNELQAELVLIDNGSTDGTWEFFRSVAHENSQVKVIRFKHNLRIHTFSIIPWLCEGRYFVLANNDVLVAKNWIQNLLACITSDPKIAVAAPVTNNTSNSQFVVENIAKHEGEQPPVSDPGKFVNWANEHNLSRPILWSERARILPTVAIYDSAIVSKLGFADPLFYSVFYWDDDFSLRLRQHGYRQILCEDTLCYHFGSVTTTDIIPKKLNGLNRSGENDPITFGGILFFRKHGQEAWFRDQVYDVALVMGTYFAVQDLAKPKILSLEFRCGDSLLQFKNHMRQNGHEFELFNLTTEPEHVADLSLSSPHVELGQGPLFKAVRKCFAGQRFDLVILGVKAEMYSTTFLNELMAAVKERLTEQGKFLMQISNPWYIKNLQSLLNFDLPRYQTVNLDPELLPPIVNKYFANLQSIKARFKNSDVRGFAQKHFNVAPRKLDELCNFISCQSSIMICSKSPLSNPQK